MGSLSLLFLSFIEDCLEDAPSSANRASFDFAIVVKSNLHALALLRELPELWRAEDVFLKEGVRLSQEIVTVGHWLGELV